MYMYMYKSQILVEIVHILAVHSDIRQFVVNTVQCSVTAVVQCSVVCLDMGGQT